MISLREVGKTYSTGYGQVNAVVDVSLDIAKGTIFGVIGHSGAGKSTLVRCINLLERPTSGSVVIGGVDMTKLSKKELNMRRKKIGMVFQNFNLMPSRTAMGNVMLPLVDTKIPKQEIRQKAEELLTLVGLSHRLEAYPAALSGGEKQRVAIARALAGDPDVLLCDEVTSALDPGSTKAILRLIKDLNAKLGITIVLITHEMAVIKEICHSVAIMDGGIVHEAGDVYSLFAAPKSQVAKEFVASTNNMSQLHELIEADSPLVRLSEGESLVKLTYLEKSAKSNLLQEATRRYDVEANIFFGNIEIISERPIGYLVIILKGQPENKDSMLAFLREKEVYVEVIK